MITFYLKLPLNVLPQIDHFINDVFEVSSSSYRLLDCLELERHRLRIVVLTALTEISGASPE